MDAVQVEEDIAIEQRLRLGIFDPVGEVFLPHPQRLSPLLVGGHDIAGAVTVAALCQAITDELRQGEEILVVLGRIEAVVQHHGVVLVGDNELLVPGHGAECHKTIRHGWWPQLLLSQLKQSLAEGAPDASHGTADHMGVRIFTDHAHKGVGHVLAQALQALHILLMIDVTDQIQAALGFVFDDVRQCNHTPHLVTLHYRQVVHVVVQHGQHGLENEGVGTGGDQLFRHDVADGCFRRQCLAEGAGAQVAVGNDA